jgi:hypothetical protein
MSGDKNKTKQNGADEMQRYKITLTTGDSFYKSNRNLLETMTGEFLYPHELREGMELVFDGLFARILSVVEV